MSEPPIEQQNRVWKQAKREAISRIVDNNEDAFDTQLLTECGDYFLTRVLTEQQLSELKNYESGGGKVSEQTAQALTRILMRDAVITKISSADQTDKKEFRNFDLLAAFEDCCRDVVITYELARGDKSYDHENAATHYFSKGLPKTQETLNTGFRKSLARYMLGESLVARVERGINAFARSTNADKTEANIKALVQHTADELKIPTPTPENIQRMILSIDNHAVTLDSTNFFRSLQDRLTIPSAQPCRPDFGDLNMPPKRNVSEFGEVFFEDALRYMVALTGTIPPEILPEQRAAYEEYLQNQPALLPKEKACSPAVGINASSAAASSTLEATTAKEPSLGN